MLDHRAQSQQKINALSKELEELNAKRQRLIVGQSGSIGTKIHNVSNSMAEEKETLGGIDEMREELRLEMSPFFDTQKLVIKSTHGDIVLKVQDPEVLVVSIPGEFGWRKKPQEIKGQPPKDPNRTIEVSTFNGHISVEYLGSPETSR